MFRSRAWSFLGSAALLGGVLLAVASAPPAAATSITVNTQLDPPANPQTGHFPSDGKCSLRAAIQSAQNNSNANDVDCAAGLGNNILDSIHIDPSLTGKTLTLTSGQPFDIVAGTNNPLEIIGPTTNSGDFIIDGNHQTRIFLLGYQGFGAPSPANSAVVKLANLTVKGGNSIGGGAFFPDGDGGAAVLGDGTHLTLDNVVFRDNSANRGGAIWANEALITNNGGAYINNTAARGGAIAFFNAASHLNGYAVLFENNGASGQGGAIAAMNGNDTTTFHLERGLLKDNHAAVGGVYWTENSAPGSALEIQDSTVTGNYATDAGGVFFAQSSKQTISYLRDTFVSNTATNGGGLFWAGAGTISNSIIKDSSCHNITFTTNFVGTSNLMGGTNTGCAFLPSIGSITGLDPTLAQNGGPEVQRTYRLLSNSNAIDAGSQSVCGTIDARSLPRGTNGIGAINSPAVGDCDIGAYEYVKYVVNFVTGTSSVLEGGTSNIGVKLTIPDPADRPLPSNVVVPVVRDQSSTARATIDYTVPPAGVTFPSGSGAGGTTTVNYTVNILQDNVAERFGEQVLFHLGNASGVAVAEPKDHFMTIQDDDQAGITKTDGGNGTTVSEAATSTSDSFGIVLRSQPDYSQPDPNDSNSYGPPADVTVTVVPDRDCTITVTNSSPAAGGGRTFTILNADWQTGRTVTVLPVNDLYDEDLRDESAVHKCVLTFTFASDDPVYNATTDAYEVNVVDNDVAGVTISKTATVLVEGGATDTYTIKLDTPPDPGKPLPGVPRAATTVTVDPDAQCDAGLGAGVPKALSFTEANYSTPQTVTMTAVDDPTVELAHTCVVTHTVGGGDPIYTNLSAAPPFAKTPTGMTGFIQDYDPPTITNDPPRVNISTGNGVHVDEATSATADTFAVVLDRQPLTQSVVVNLAVSSDPNIPQPQLGLQLAPPAPQVPASSTLPVTFTPANWNVPQTVRVYAGNDDYDEASPYGVSAYVRATLSSSAVGFSSPTLRQFKLDAATPVLDTVDIPVTVDDDDVSSVVLSPDAAALAVTEGGATDSYTVRLGSHPYADVTVSVQSTSQCTVNGQPVGSSSVLTFPAATWSVPQTVIVAAVDDNLIEVGGQTCTITNAAASGGDVLYDGLSGPSATATVTDNDLPRVVTTTAGGVAVSEATSATPDSYDVVLFSQPDAVVTVHVTVSDGQTKVSHGGAPASAVELTFTPADWNIAQTVNVNAVDDAADETSPHSGAVTHTLTSTATGYATAPEFYVDGAPASSVPVSISDDDTAGFTLTESGGSTSVDEGGPADTVSYSLTSQPTSDVTVTPTSGSPCVSSPASLTFTSANWSAPQAVSVSAPDNDTVDAAVTCALTSTSTSTDSLYAVAVPSVTVTVVEDDLPSVLIAGAPLSLSEAGGAPASYTVVLGARPTADVHVIAAVADGQTTLTGGLASVDLTFTSTTWDTPQTVDVKAVDDATHEGPHSGTIGHTVTSAAVGFGTTPLFSVDGVAGSAVPVTIADNDGSNLGLSAIDVTPVAVGGSAHQWNLVATNQTANPPASGVLISTTVPAGTQFSATDSDPGWSCPAGIGAGKVCTISAGTLSQGTPYMTVFGVQVPGPFAAGVSTLTLLSSVADDGGSGPDPAPADNGVTVVTPLDVAPDLGVTVTAPATIVTGTLATYTVSWTNTGLQDATGAVISVPVPAGTTFHKTGSAPAWSCADGDVAGTVCTAAVSGASGGSGSLAFLVDVPAAAGSTVSFTASIADDGTNGVDPTPANNSGSGSSSVTLPPPPPPPPPSPTPSASASPAASVPPVIGGTSAPGLGAPAASGGPGEPPSSPAPPCPAATVCAPPTMAFDRSEITAGGVVHVTGTARRGATVTLLGYSRPATTYLVLRNGVADDTGHWAFTLAPTTNSRLFARSVDGSSPSAVVRVRSVVSLAPTLPGGCVLVAKGSVYPKRSRVHVDIEYRGVDGRWVPAMAVATGAGGLYSVGRAFSTCGSPLVWRAVTRTTIVNTAGASPPRTVRLTP